MATRRNERVLAAIHRVLDRDEDVIAEGRCWAAVRRPRVPLLFLGRHRHDAFLTDRRLVLVATHHRTLRPNDVALVKRFPSISLVGERRGVALLQQRLELDTGTAMVLEWPARTRAMGHRLSRELPHLEG